MKIIFADDHVMLREALAPFLGRLHPNAQVHEAGSLADVKEHLDRLSPDLIILDLKMPGMNGCEGITKVRKRAPDAKCAILSAVSERRVALDAIAAGANGFIPKQLSGSAMVSALQLILAGETFIPSLILRATNDVSPPPLPGVGALTQREQDILRLLKEGLSNKAIANRLGVSDVTIKTHLSNAFRKIGVQSRLQAMRLLLEA